MSYLFFRRAILPLAQAPEPRQDLTVEFWRPRWGQLRPAELPMVPFGAWSLFDLLGGFQTRDYALLLMKQAGWLVNRACIFPAHYKFPFMARGDLQVAGLWTHPELRGAGLGLRAVAEVLRRFADPQRELWYLAKEANAPSIRLAQKADFALCGRGERLSRFGLRALGYFELSAGCGAAPARRRPDPGPETAEGP